MVNFTHIVTGCCSRCFLLLLLRWILQNCVLVLQRVIAIHTRRLPHAYRHIKLQTCKNCHRKPQWNGDGIILIRNVINSKIIEHFIRNESPNHVNYKNKCTKNPGDEALNFYKWNMGLLIFTSYHVNLLEASFFVFLVQVRKVVEDLVEVVFVIIWKYTRIR